jgi:hypothetical protein
MIMHSTPVRRRIWLCLAPLILFATVASAQKAGGAGDIHHVDFKNFTYRPFCIYEKPVSVRTRNGEYTRERGDDKMAFEVRSVNYGDLTGDGRDEAVVLTNCNTGGTGQFSEGFVFTMRRGRPVLLTRIAGGDRAFGGLAGAKVEDRLLIVESYAPEEPGSGACCPKYVETARYRWNGRRLVKVGKTVRRPYEQ